ncbi:hypothetical protein TYRP_020709 [Tyrophagus putrescentiae]|nr:hypothetical protein TYRP_020709 [Tyrophagus putrescentiae]
MEPEDDSCKWRKSSNPTRMTRRKRVRKSPSSSRPLRLISSAEVKMLSMSSIISEPSSSSSSSPNSSPLRR